jgi:hypothetical protein
MEDNHEDGYRIRNETERHGGEAGRLQVSALQEGHRVLQGCDFKQGQSVG